jgi:BMFP domain-containing protein YqiC
MPLAAPNQTEYTRPVPQPPENRPDNRPENGGSGGGSSAGSRPISDSLREAVEGAFAATGLTRDKAQDLSDRTRDRAQDLVGEVSRLGRDAREAFDGMRLVSRDEIADLSGRLEEIEARLEALESTAGTNPEE